MRKTIWGKLCGPYGVCSSCDAQGFVVVFGEDYMLFWGLAVVLQYSRGVLVLCVLYFGGAALCMHRLRDICILENMYFV